MRGVEQKTVNVLFSLEIDNINAKMFQNTRTYRSWCDLGCEMLLYEGISKFKFFLSSQLSQNLDCVYPEGFQLGVAWRASVIFYLKP